MPRVLLVDDHEDFRQEVQRLLESEFDVVGVASDGKTALEVAKRLSPEVVVLDVRMPVMGGVEAATRLLQCSSNVKVVFLSSHYSPSLIHEALLTGALGYVFKASAIEDLSQAIWEALEDRVFISSSSASASSTLTNHH